MVAYTIFNSTNSQLTDVNAGGKDVPARSARSAITLTTAELAAVLTTAGVSVTKDAPTYQQKRNIAKTTKYCKVVAA